MIVRTIVGESKADLEGKVEAARADGWAAIGNPSHLLIGGVAAKGQPTWIQHMRKP